MKTINYQVEPCLSGGFNYTIVNRSYWHQMSLKIRERVLYKMTEMLVPIYKRFFKPAQTKWQVSLEQLEQYPEGTLGKAWFNFYKDESFGISPNYEEHDICHVILGYRTSIVEETRMYSFLFGTGKISAPTLFTIIIGSIALPEFVSEFYADYKLGKQSLNFQKWDFRYLLNEEVSTLRKMIYEGTQKKIIERVDY